MMNVTKTSRGFAFIEFEDSNGRACRLQKSSLATEDCIWLGCCEIGLKRFTSGLGWEVVPLEQPESGVSYIANPPMHLTREQVAALLPALRKFVETGEIE